MEVLPAPDGAVIMIILLGVAMCKEKKEKANVKIEACRFLTT
ncbi:MAG TPA: hypothetical protein VK559_03805 [Ferruginibacter sp.]|nr:hypothetical protein [Ferruginibacter sp.]